MSINVEKRILASSTRYLERSSGERDDTWYHCERLDKVTHHNSWVCKKIGGIDAIDDVIEPSNPHVVTKLVPVSWYVPKVFHRAVIWSHLAETKVEVKDA